MTNLRKRHLPQVSIEPYTHALDVVPRAELEALLTSAHIFSPNEKEAFSLVGPGEPLDVVARLVEAGAQVRALRPLKDEDDWLVICMYF